MKQRDILLIVVPAFIMVVLWVAFSIYHNHVSSTISEPLSLQIEPIGKTFDLKTLGELKKRERLNPVYEKVGSEISEDNLKETEVATSSSEATQSAELSESEEL